MSDATTGPPVVTPPPVVPIDVGPRSPDSDDFDRIWNLYFSTVAAVAAHRALDGGVPRLGLLAADAMDALTTAAEDVRRPSRRSSRSRARGVRSRFCTRRCVTSSGAIRTRWSVVRIMGSIDKLLNKLPRPLRKLMDGILEALKLTRGLTS